MLQQRNFSVQLHPLTVVCFKIRDVVGVERQSCRRHRFESSTATPSERDGRRTSWSAPVAAFYQVFTRPHQLQCTAHRQSTRHDHV